jgi:hypothetical protein
VVFGRVIDGMLTLRKIENVPTGPNNRPKLVVKIVGTFWLPAPSPGSKVHLRMRRNVAQLVLINVSISIIHSFPKTVYVSSFTGPHLAIFEHLTTYIMSYNLLDDSTTLPKHQNIQDHIDKTTSSQKFKNLGLNIA